MLIEQTIDFELKGPGPPGCTCTPTSTYFYDKTKKISKENFQVDCYLLLKYCTRQSTLFSPTLAQLLSKFNPKMQDFKRGYELNCKQKKNSLIVLIGVLMLNLSSFKWF